MLSFLRNAARGDALATDPLHLALAELESEPPLTPSGSSDTTYDHMPDLVPDDDSSAWSTVSTDEPEYYDLSDYGSDASVSSNAGLDSASSSASLPTSSDLDADETALP